MNYPVNRTDFTLTRYVDNEIEFWIKNIDRKAVPLSTSSATIYITEPTSNRPLLKRELRVLDAAKGLVQLFVTGEEAAAMPPGFLRYSVVLNRADNTQLMLYTDRDRKGIGTIEVVTGPIPDPVEAMPLSLSDFLTRNNRLYSAALPGAAMTNNVSGQHSVVLHLAGFTGRFTVQGSLDNQPSSNDALWFDVAYRDFIQESAVVHFPFEGNLMNVRFIVDRLEGSIDLIQYRN